MKKLFFILIIIMTFLFVLYWFKFRRTAYTVAQTITNLEISRKYKTEIFKEEWSPNGDGESLIIFSILKDQQSYLIELCKKLEFKKLPIKEVLPDNFIYKYINYADTMGYYQLIIDKADKRNYKIVIINQPKEQLIIYNVIY